MYENPEKKKIRIQGLSGTGKTKLLLHKLKDLYVNDNNSSIFFTCHNKILADNLRKRIPDFFNFMKVEQQILWNKRLWCTNAWGSEALPHSGAYRYICAYYQIPFFRFSNFMPFSKACQQAILEIKEKFKEEKKFAFTYMIIDESQDFVEDFFELCELVTEKNIYIAGDIFQSIFDENISSSIEPDFLLGKCYRTDPKTLMFAHALGMGLFEEKKLRWLEEKEWKDCGYNVTVKESHYYLNREPLRRFEDLEDNFESIEIIENGQKVIESVIKLINTIISENDTVLPDDIGIIFLDEDKSIYQLADILEVKIQSTFNWIVNKAYESKEKKKETLFISNKNNVKGLEFPFVIAITNKIKNSLIYRNSIYTILTRSFIKTYLILSNGEKSGLTLGMKEGLKDIMINKEMVIQEPSNEEKERIRTNFKYKLKRLSYYDLMLKYFKELNIDKQFYDQIIKAVYDLNISDTDDDSLKNLILTMEKALKNK